MEAITEAELDFQYEMELEAKMEADCMLEEIAIANGFESKEEMKENEDMRWDDMLAAQGQY